MVGAIDIGGTKTMIAILHKDGSFIAKDHFATEKAAFYQHAKKCADRFDNLKKEAKIEKVDFPVGISLPAIVNPGEGYLNQAPFAGWRNICAKEEFEKLLKCHPVYIDNDARNCALGEAWFNDAGEDYLWVTISTGIGSSIVSGKNQLLGSSFSAGELGHIKVETKNPRQCTCGQQGCLEAHASGTAITAMFNEALAGDALLRQEREALGVPKDALGCARLAQHGNLTCRTIYETAGNYIGIALSHAFMLLNPSCVYFGGGISRDLDLLLPAIQKRLALDVIPQNKKVRLQQSGLGYEASLLGAAALALLHSGTQP